MPVAIPVWKQHEETKYEHYGPFYRVLCGGNRKPAQQHGSNCGRHGCARYHIALEAFLSISVSCPEGIITAHSRACFSVVRLKAQRTIRLSEFKWKTGGKRQGKFCSHRGEVKVERPRLRFWPIRHEREYLNVGAAIDSSTPAHPYSGPQQLWLH